MNWIYTTEGQPGSTEYYIVATMRNNRPCECVEICFFNALTQEWRTPYGYKVYAWMPLPTMPPLRGENNNGK